MHFHTYAQFVVLDVIFSQFSPLNMQNVGKNPLKTLIAQFIMTPSLDVGMVMQTSCESHFASIFCLYLFAYLNSNFTTIPYVVYQVVVFNVYKLKIVVEYLARLLNQSFCSPYLQSFCLTNRQIWMGHKHVKVSQKKILIMQKNKIVDFGGQKVGHFLF